MVTGGADGSGPAAGEVEAGDLAGDVERRHELAAGLLEQEGAQALVGAGGQDGPVGGVSVQHGRLEPAEDVPVRRRPYALDGVTVPQLLEGDGAPGRAVGQRGEKVGGTQAQGGDGGEDGRGEVGPWERELSHLLLHDDGVDQAQPQAAVRLGDQQPEPAQVGQLRG